MTIRFAEEQVRPMGRASRGVRGIHLSENDVVVSMESLLRGAASGPDEAPPPADGPTEDVIEQPAASPEEAAAGEPADEPPVPSAATPEKSGRAAVTYDSLRPPPAAADETAAILTLCTNGYGKRTLVGEYRAQNRGGKGLIDIKTTERNGPVVGQLLVREVDHIMLISNAGTVLRCRVHEISCIGRNTQGVRIIRLAEGETLVAVEKWAEAEAENGLAGAATEAADAACEPVVSPEADEEDTADGGKTPGEDGADGD
jgi:DNA gyrase/topoisomerase IV subunit A